MQELRPMKRRNKAHKLSGWEAVLGRCFWHLCDTKHICRWESNAPEASRLSKVKTWLAAQEVRPRPVSAGGRRLRAGGHAPQRSN